MAIYELPIYGKREIPDQYKDLVLEGLKFQPGVTTPERIDWRNRMSYAGLNPNFFESNAGRSLLEWVKAGADPNNPMSYAEVNSTPYSPGQESPGIDQKQITPTVIQAEKAAAEVPSEAPAPEAIKNVYKPQADTATQTATQTTPATVPTALAPVDTKYADLEKKLAEQESKYSDLLNQFNTYKTNQTNYQDQRNSMAGSSWVPGSPWTQNMYGAQADASITQPAYQRTQFNQTNANQTTAPTFTPGVEQVPYQYQYANGMTQTRQTNMLPWGSQYGTNTQQDTGRTGYQGKQKDMSTTLAGSPYGSSAYGQQSGGQVPSYSMLAGGASLPQYGGTSLAAGTPRDQYNPYGGNAYNVNDRTSGNRVVTGNYTGYPQTGNQVNLRNGQGTSYTDMLNNEPSGQNDMNADLMNAASMYYGTGNYYNTYGPAGSTPMYGGREFKAGYNLPQEAESRYAQGAQYEQYLPQIFQAYAQGMPTIPDMPQWAAPTADYGSDSLRTGLQTAATQPDRSMITENTVGNSIYDMINRISGSQGSGNLTQDIQSQIASAIAPQDAYNQTLRDQMVADAERNFAAEKTKAIDEAKRYFGHYNLSGSSAELAKLKEIEDEYAKRSDDIRRAIDIQTAQNAQTMQQNRLPQLISALTGISGTDQNALNLGLNLLGSQQSGVNNEYSRLMAALNEATGAQTTNRANTLSDYLTQRQENLDQYNLGQQNFTNLAQILGMTGNLYDQFRGTGYDLMQGNADAMANLAAGYLSRAATRSANTQGWANLLGNLAGSGAMAAATYGSGGGVQ